MISSASSAFFMDNANTPYSPTNPRTVDFVVEPEWILPIEPAGLLLTGHALAVRDGRIEALLPTDQMRAQFSCRETFRLPGQLLMPGLVNLHCHSAMSLLRGYADDLPLMRWLQERIWPAEGALAGKEFVATGSKLAALEMLRGGTTCVNDMYFFPEETAKAMAGIGMRATLGMIVIDFPTAYAQSGDDYLAKGLQTRDDYADNALLSFCLAPHAPYTVSDPLLQRISELSAQLDVPIHIHMHETEQEIADEVVRTGMRPVDRLDRLGIIGPRTIAVHAVHLSDTEMALLARRGAHLAHCPTSNLKLGSGIANVPAWERHGITWGLGTDGAASNNRLDAWQELRHAALLAKGRSHDASALTAHRVLSAATLGGAKALGLDSKIGSLLPGKAADMIAVRLDEWIYQPCYDPVSHLVYVTGREQVSHVWVAGELLMANGVLSCANLTEVLAEAEFWRQKLLQL